MTNTPTQAAIEAAAEAIGRLNYYATDTNKARAAIEAYRAAMREAGEGWQPIETAPRDQVILLFGTLFGAPDGEDNLYPRGAIRVCGYWEQIDEAWALTDTTWAGPFINPTHWMPLPNPPST